MTCATYTQLGYVCRLDLIGTSHTVVIPLSCFVVALNHARRQISCLRMFVTRYLDTLRNETM